MARGGGEALQIAAAHPPDAVILDLGLPDLDGADVITGLRGWSTVPILVLSGRSDSTGKVDALDAGADDYVTKPFGIDGADGARMGHAPPQHSICSDSGGRVRRNPRRPRRQSGDGARRGGPAIPTERHLLEVLVRHPASLLSQHYLFTEAWGPGHETARGNLRRYMARLREKLELEPSRPQYFRTGPAWLPLPALVLTRSDGARNVSAGYNSMASARRAACR